jgi:hypothetical protein
LDKFVEHQALYKPAGPDVQKVMKALAYSEWMAFLLLRGSDPNKYGSLNQGLVTQFSLGQNQYPSPFTGATDVLSNHKIDARYYKLQKKSRERSNSEKSSSKTDEEGKAASFAQGGKEVICYCCGKKGHVVPDCDQQNKIYHNQ